MVYDVLLPHYARYNREGTILSIIPIQNKHAQDVESQLEHSVAVALKELNNPSRNGHAHYWTPSKKYPYSIDVSSRGHHNHYRGHKTQKQTKVVTRKPPRRRIVVIVPTI